MVLPIEHSFYRLAFIASAYPHLALPHHPFHLTFDLSLNWQVSNLLVPISLDEVVTVSPPEYDSDTVRHLYLVSLEFQSGLEILLVVSIR